MTHTGRTGLTAGVFALALGLNSFALARAQDLPADMGLIVGEVARCVNGAEQAAAQVSVGVEGGASSLARTDSGGQFFLPLPPGQYTITATAADGSASRQYVPVEAGQALDIGILDLGGGVAGCGPDSAITAPVLPTFTPTMTAVPVLATPTVVATPQPTLAPATPTPEPASEPTPEP
jgi:hypothetical protein